jgi:hypothetical protein
MVKETSGRMTYNDGYQHTDGSGPLDLCQIVLSPEEIQRKRFEVSRDFKFLSTNIKTDRITKIAPTDLQLLFELYDEVFFDRYFDRYFLGKLRFSLSRRLTSSAGKTLCPKNIGCMKPDEVVIEIRMGIGFFFHYDAVESEKKVNGITTRNALEALQLVFEHEICHVIEFINFHTSNCHGKCFKTIAHNLFGHLQSYHQLPTRRRIVQEKLGLQLGDPVSFVYAGKVLSGILYRINKRAVVMVKDRHGRYTDCQGHRYSKYYVPVELLNR